MKKTCDSCLHNAVCKIKETFCLLSGEISTCETIVSDQFFKENSKHGAGWPFSVTVSCSFYKAKDNITLR